MHVFTRIRGVLAIGAVAALAMTVPAAASPIPPHQTSQRDNTVLDDPGDQNCTVDHWHNLGYCEVEHPDPRLMGGLVFARALPTTEGWVAKARLIWIDAHTGDVLRTQSVSREYPLDWTPSTGPVSHPDHIPETVVADGWPTPNAVIRGGGSSPPPVPDGGSARVGCLATGEVSTASLTCTLLD